MFQDYTLALEYTSPEIYRTQDLPTFYEPRPSMAEIATYGLCTSSVGGYDCSRLLGHATHHVTFARQECTADIKASFRMLAEWDDEPILRAADVPKILSMSQFYRRRVVARRVLARALF